MSYHDVKRILIFFSQLLHVKLWKATCWLYFITTRLLLFIVYFSWIKYKNRMSSKPLASFVLLTHNVVMFLGVFFNKNIFCINWGCEQQILHSLKLVLKPAAGSQLLCQEVCSMLEKMCGMEVNVRTVTYLLEKAFMEADPPVERKRIKLTDWINLSEFFKINCFILPCLVVITFLIF